MVVTFMALMIDFVDEENFEDKQDLMQEWSFSTYSTFEQLLSTGFKKPATQQRARADLWM